MKSKPILVQKSKKGITLEAVNIEKGSFSEKWLQELIQNHPQILPVDDIEPVYSSLVPIGREIPMGIGYIDNLLISKSGYPVIVETKLWRNSEAKREVVAQAIEYGSALAKWSFKDLDDVTRKKTSKGLIELIQTAFDLDDEELPSEDIIARNLRSGRFLILIVSDHIRSSVIEMLNYTNQIPHLAINVGLIEMQCFKMPLNDEDIIVFPSVIARTEIITRSVVEINLKPDINHEIIVSQKKEPENKKLNRYILSEDMFWEKLHQSAPACEDAIHQIFDHFAKHNEINFEMRQAARVLRLSIPDNDGKISIFYTTVNGEVGCWSKIIYGQLENAELERSLGEDYIRKIYKLLKSPIKDSAALYSADKIDLKELFEIADEFITQVIMLEPKNENEQKPDD